MEPKIDKVTVNIGVGETGEKLDKAYSLVQTLVEQKPIKTTAKSKVPTWGLREGLPIGIKVTLRKDKANKFLKNAFVAVENKLNESCFDKFGNFSFGVSEYIELPNAKYDPKIGVFGLDVCVTMKKPGYRIKARKRHQKKIAQKHALRKEESVAYITKKFGVEVVK